MTEQEFWDILAAMPQPQPVFWRLYYNDDGSPLRYSMEHWPEPYVEIDPDTYALADIWVRVVDGKIRKINRYTAQKLVRSDHGTQCHDHNVAVIDPFSHTMWSKQQYGIQQN